MNATYPGHWPQFYTATINNWQHLLSDDKHKDIIVDSLKFLVTEKRIELNAFVIMSNHIHLIWQAMFGFTPSDIQASFMKYTAQQLKRSLAKNNTEALETFKVNKYNKEYQFWKRDSLGIELFSPAVFEQKVNYIHYNPVKAGLCTNPEDYHYSSAKFYYDGTDNFGILTHYMGN
jgi:REP element-mobilizing transposase RayT